MNTLEDVTVLVKDIDFQQVPEGRKIIRAFELLISNIASLQSQAHSMTSQLNSISPSFESKKVCQHIYSDWKAAVSNGKVTGYEVRICNTCGFTDTRKRGGV